MSVVNWHNQVEFESIREELEISRSVYVKSFEAEEFVRSVDDAFFILDNLEKIQSNLSKNIKKHSYLENLFEKEFVPLKDFFKRDHILDLCFIEDYIFPELEAFPIVAYEKFDKDLILSYEQTFTDWVEVKIENHEKTQEIILDKFDIRLNQRLLDCDCLKCIADYRAKLRDAIYDKCIEKIVTLNEWLNSNINSSDIENISTTFSKYRKDIEKLLHSVRYRLKKGSLNKLEKSLRQELDDHFNNESKNAKMYRDKLVLVCDKSLEEQGYQKGLVSEFEYNRFLKQLGLNLWKNEKYILREFNKLLKSLLVLKKKDISSSILKEYLGQFWVHSSARRLNRKIIYHMGPTNSGKTFHAIESLCKAKKGCYLAPLRLLASELYDTLNSKGVITTLLTGEEVIEVENSTHTSSTIEMAKLHDEFDCCVIDEIQMISDSQRGWAWTRALININSQEVHLCGDNTVLELVEKIVELTGDNLEIKEYSRLTELKVQKNPIKLVNLEPGDALIVFSRKNALKYKSDLERLGYKVSIVYGRLSPEVRREQARKFDVGETDIIVSTDAISMGMNLPIKRIVFSTLAKYINSKEIFITNSEIKQISGRAGRYGRYPVGFINCLSAVEDGLDKISHALSTTLVQSAKAMVGPDLEIFDRVNSALENHALTNLNLPDFLRLFNTMEFQTPFYCVELNEMIELAEIVENANRDIKSLTSTEIFGFTCAPVNLGIMEHVQYYIWIVNQYVHSRNIFFEEIDEDSDNIDYLETSIKCIELYQWLSRHFNQKHFDYNENILINNKSMAIDKLNKLLSEKLVRNCSSCGIKLPDEFDFNICDSCFKQRRFSRRPNFSKKRGTDQTKKGRKKFIKKNNKKRSKKKRPRK